MQRAEWRNDNNKASITLTRSATARRPTRLTTAVTRPSPPPSSSPSTLQLSADDVVRRRNAGTSPSCSSTTAPTNLSIPVVRRSVGLEARQEAYCCVVYTCPCTVRPAVAAAAAAAAAAARRSIAADAAAAAHTPLDAPTSPCRPQRRRRRPSQMFSIRKLEHNQSAKTEN